MFIWDIWRFQVYDFSWVIKKKSSSVLNPWDRGHDKFMITWICQLWSSGHVVFMGMIKDIIQSTPLTYGISYENWFLTRCFIKFRVWTMLLMRLWTLDWGYDHLRLRLWSLHWRIKIIPKTSWCLFILSLVLEKISGFGISWTRTSLFFFFSRSTLQSDHSLSQRRS